MTFYHCVFTQILQKMFDFDNTNGIMCKIQKTSNTNLELLDVDLEECRDSFVRGLFETVFLDVEGSSDMISPSSGIDSILAGDGERSSSLGSKSRPSSDSARLVK